MARAEGYESDAVDLMTAISYRFRDELGRLTLSATDHRFATTDDVWEAFHCMMASRPDWATKDTATPSGGN